MIFQSTTIALMGSTLEKNEEKYAFNPFLRESTIRNSVNSGYQIYHYYNHCTMMIRCNYDTVLFILSPNFTEILFKQK